MESKPTCEFCKYLVVKLVDGGTWFGCLAEDVSGDTLDFRLDGVYPVMDDCWFFREGFHKSRRGGGNAS